MTSVIDMSTAALTFNKKSLAKIAKSDDSTLPALLLIMISSLVSGAVAYTNGTPSQFVDALIDEQLNDLGYFIADFVFQLLYLLFLGFFLSLTIRMFGGQSSVMNVVRMVGATSIWSIIASIVLLFSSIGVFIAFIGFIALLVGISAYSGKGILIVFIALIVAAILMLIVLFFLFPILILVVLGVLVIV